MNKLEELKAVSLEDFRKVFEASSREELKELYKYYQEILSEVEEYE